MGQKEADTVLCSAAMIKGDGLWRLWRLVLNPCLCCAPCFHQCLLMQEPLVTGKAELLEDIKKRKKMSPILSGLSGSQRSMKEAWALLGVHAFSQEPDGLMAKAMSFHCHHFQNNSLHWKKHPEHSHLKQQLCTALARWFQVGPSEDPPVPWG